MSKTYRKTLRFGICTGSNIEYYEARRRNHRRQLSDELRNAVKKTVKTVKSMRGFCLLSSSRKTAGMNRLTALGR